MALAGAGIAPQKERCVKLDFLKLGGVILNLLEAVFAFWNDQISLVFVSAKPL